MSKVKGLPGVFHIPAKIVGECHPALPIHSKTGKHSGIVPTTLWDLWKNRDFVLT
jgi:hypothetical protein